ncbi:MAG: fluoride efflux transporter CrcB [Actinobacteria bacterium]|nr:fluoride efflux transporter CrcB [Actinomycetota bacterium]
MYRPTHPGARVDIDPEVQSPDLAAGGPTRPVLAAVALGGILGAEARYGAGRALTHPADGFPWSTLAINVTGCLLIGVLMAILQRLPRPHRLARPFFGTGILGGYTTYSTFAVEVQQLVRAHRAGTAAGYLAATVVGCAAAVWLATAVTVRAWDRYRGAAA